MNEDFQSNNYSDQINGNRIKGIFDLGLINNERIGDILFFLGTILSWISSNQEEHSILQNETQSQEASSANDSVKTIALASWIFLIASLFFASTAYSRLMEKSANPAMENITGSEIAALGDFVKVIGFTLSAIGNQITANDQEIAGVLK